jgi:hypothetical protein
MGLAQFPGKAPVYRRKVMAGLANSVGDVQDSHLGTCSYS